MLDTTSSTNVSNDLFDFFTSNGNESTSAPTVVQNSTNNNNNNNNSSNSDDILSQTLFQFGVRKSDKNSNNLLKRKSKGNIAPTSALEVKLKRLVHSLPDISYMLSRSLVTTSNGAHAQANANNQQTTKRTGKKLKKRMSAVDILTMNQHM